MRCINWQIKKDDGYGGTGVIIRDHEGYVFVSTCFLKKFVVDLTVVEAYAAW